MTIILH